MSPGYVLAFDFGDKHIGVAVGQTVTATANPLTTLKARGGQPDWRQVAGLVEQWRPLALIVGLPLNMDDSESAMSARARRFANRLGARCRVPVHLVDERLTSFAARQSGASLDAGHGHAAALIAESWLRGG